MKFRALIFLLFIICFSGSISLFSQSTTYTRNNLMVEVLTVNPCNSTASNGSITFKLIGSSSGRANLILITGPATTIFPDIELNLTNQNTYTFIPDTPQEGLFDFVIRDPVNTGDFINTLVSSVSGVELKTSIPITFPGDNQESNSPSCKGLSDGSLRLDASGGNGLFTYSIDNGTTFQNTPVFKNLSAGTYRITAKDQIGCEGTQDFILTEPDELNFTATTELATCNGSNDGLIRIVATGGNGTYEYSNDNGQSFQPSPTLNNLNPGTFSVIVKDQKDCRSNPKLFDITEPAEINISALKTDVTLCDPGNDGTITGTASGGTGPLTYSIDGTNFQSSPVFTNLKNSLYLLTAKDSKGCTEFIPVTINTPSDPLFFFTIKDLNCFNDNSGEINITGFGGTAPLEYSVNGGSTFQSNGNFQQLSAGVYKLQVRDAKSCKLELTTALFQPGEIVSTIQTTPIQCNGQSNGSISLSAIGGNPDFQYSIDNGVTFSPSGSFINLSPGNYLTLIKDSKECRSKISTINLTDPPALVVTGTVTNASCSNNDGRIQLKVTGGTIPLSYEINGTTISSFPAGGILTGLSEGKYAFKTIDARGCSRENTFNVTFPGRVNATALATPPDCSANGTNGFISVTINTPGNFQAGLSYNPPAAPQNFITVNSGTFQFEGLKNGDYSVVINDNILCPTILPVTISGGPVPVSFKTEVVEKICAENRAFVRLSNFSGNTLIGYNAEVRTENGNIYKSQFISALLAALRPVEIDIPDEGNYQVILSQDQSTTTPCNSPISTPVVTIRLDAPESILDVTDIEKTISFLDLPTGSLSGKIIESLEEPYQTRLELIDPYQDGQSYLSEFEILTRDDTSGEYRFKYSKIYAGQYELTVKDAFGCVKQFPLSVDFDPKIFIPNIFTPDGDGINDEFFIRNLPPNSKVDITDSWGQKVFSTSNYKNDWSAKNTPNGIYFYSLLIGKKTYSGWVEILTGK